MDPKCLDKVRESVLIHDEVVANIAGEYSAIHQYNQVIDRMSWIDSERKMTTQEKQLFDVLHHIVQEEEEHVKELRKFESENLKETLEAFADCECAARQQQVTSTVKVKNVRPA